MARYGIATPKRYCIPGILDPIYAIIAKAITAANGKRYFIYHSLASN